VKDLISDEVLHLLEQKGEDPYVSMNIDIKLIIISNYLIKIRGMEEKDLEKIDFLPFNNRFVGVLKDPNVLAGLKTKSAQEYILKMAVIGAKEYIANNYEFIDCKECQEQVKIFKAQMK
jgi:phage/plasmid-associated DNA primase